MTVDHIQNLTIEFDSDGGVGLEQDCTGNTARVFLHPIQLRYLAERAGLAATSDPQGQRYIETLKRRLILLRDRIDHLSGYMSSCSDTSHANLDYEIGFINATSDIATEFCADIADMGYLASKVAPVPTLRDKQAAAANQQSLIE